MIFGAIFGLLIAAGPSGAVSKQNRETYIEKPMETEHTDKASEEGMNSENESKP